jgi:hypothetical protein
VSDLNWFVLPGRAQPQAIVLQILGVSALTQAFLKAVIGQADIAFEDDVTRRSLP